MIKKIKPKYKLIRVNETVYDILKSKKQYNGQSFNSLFFNHFKIKKGRK